MKKTVLFALCLTLLLSLSIFVVGCGKHTHSFTEKVTTDEYLATAADCVNEATYYFSCKCGEKGTERFKYGSPLGHSFTNYVSNDDATCTKNGTQTAKRDRCNEIITKTEAGTKLGHIFNNYVSNDNATCTEDGTETAVCERAGCGATSTRLAVNSKKGHTIVVDSGIKATCTTDGLTEGSHCSVCDKVLVAQIVIPAAHTICIDHAVKVTCTTDGLTEGSHCSVCNEVFVAQTVIPAKGHTEVIDKAVAPTAFTNGLTEGKHCSVCNNVLVAQEIIPATGIYDGLKYSKLSDKTCAVIGVDDYTGDDIVIPKTIPNGYTVTVIGEKAFADCTATSIYIPDGIKKIGTRAFYNCANITEIHIPSSVTEIGTQIFYKASSLNTVYYDSMYSNSDNPFLNITNIKKIVFGGSRIPPYILQSCVNITEVEMLNVTSVGELAFSGCNNLEKVNIGSIAKWCSIKFLGVWPYSDRHASNPLSYAHNLYLNGSLVTDLVIPNGVKSISEYAFV